MLVAVCECGTRITIPKRAKAAKEMENHARNAYATQVILNTQKHDDYEIVEESELH